MSNYPWFQPRHLLFMLLVYGAFALVGGLVTFFVFWSHVSPHSLVAFLVGATVGIVLGAAGIILQHFWRRAASRIAHPIY
jgi:hypothetical protein